MKKIINLILFVGIILVITGCGSKQTNDSNNLSKLTQSKSFFLKDEEGQYHLFNHEGAKITDTSFKEATTFYNGYSLVYNNEGEYGIINENGKMSVDFGIYDKIIARGGLFEGITTDESNISQKNIINGYGKVISDLKNESHETFYNLKSFSILKNIESYHILNYQGDKIFSISRKSSESSPLEKNPSENFLLLSYEGKHYLIDLNNNKKIYEFSDNDNYCVLSEFDKISEVIIYNCTETGEQRTKHRQMYLKNEKLMFDLVDKCTRISFSSDNIVCEDISEGERYFLDSKGNKFLKDNRYNSYTDDNTYLISKTNNLPVVEFYKNGKLSKSIECTEIFIGTKLVSDFYRLGVISNSSCPNDNKGFKYYDFNGEPLDNINYLYARDFEENGFAQVSIDRQKHYLINTKGEKVTDEYDSIRYLGSNYYEVRSNNKTSVINTKDEVLLSGDYTNINFENNNNKEYLGYRIKPGNSSEEYYVLYSISEKREIVRSKRYLSLNQNYISTADYESQGGYNYITKYYTYSGKLFFES